jgi:hypothetical protein
MPDINASLKTTINGKGPQHKLHRVNEFEFTEGSDGALHTKIVDKNGNPIDSSKTEVSNFPNDYPDGAVRQELESVKAELQSLKEHTFNTQLSGSNEALDTNISVSNDTQDYLRGEVIPAGSSINIGHVRFNGTRIGVGMRLDIPVQVELRLQYYSEGSSVAIGRPEPIFSSDEEVDRVVDNADLKLANGTIVILNNSDIDTVITRFNVTEFMASGGNIS